MLDTDGRSELYRRAAVTARSRHGTYQVQGAPEWRFAGRLHGVAYIVGIGRQMSPVIPIKEPERW